MNEWRPSYLGVAVAPRTRPMAPELRGSCLARRQGSSSDVRSVREKAQVVRNVAERSDAAVPPNAFKNPLVR